MAIAGADAALNPAQSAEEIGRRFLKLLGAVSSKSDITVEHVQEVLGLTLDSDPIYPSYTQSLGDDWFYSIRYAIEMPGQSRGVELAFENETDPFPQRFPFCNVSYDDYHIALTRMGFRYRRGGDGKFPGINEYDKDDFYVQIVPEVRQSTEGKAHPACVRKIGLFVPNHIPGHP